MSGNGRAILITGCSSGIGYTCAHGMAERGWHVIAAARKSQDIARLEAEGLETLQLDYADPKSVAGCADEVLRRTDGKPYALFNNGAYGQPGAVEDLTPDTLRAQFEANVFGWHDLTCRLVPAMRANGGGRIVQCSSVLGLVAMKWRGAYNASKFAIEALSDTMRLEVKDAGIHVCQIEPGPIRSRFRQHAIAHLKANVDMDNSPHRDEYARQLSIEEPKLKADPRPPEKPAEARARAGRQNGPRYRLGPDAVLDRLIHATESARPKPRYYVTTPTVVMATARRILPHRMLDRLANKFS
ncbi:MAG: SDR family oxidoreductase [Hyphomicrobiales bacterium]|nr:SDR family oxidoreductase [Hyphomicrobiales bacterium]